MFSFMDIQSSRLKLRKLCIARGTEGLDAILSTMMMVWFGFLVLMVVVGYFTYSLKWWAALILGICFLAAIISIKLGYLKYTTYVYSVLWIVNLYIQNLTIKDDHTYLHDNIWPLVYAIVFPLIMDFKQLVFTLGIGFPSTLVPFIRNVIDESNNLDDTISLIRIYITVCVGLIILSIIHLETINIKNISHSKLIDSKDRIELEKDQFFSNVSHEMRTPLNGILGMHQILMDVISRSRIPNREEICDSLDVIQFCTESLMILVDDLMDLAKLDAKSMEIEMVDFDIIALIDNAAKMTRSVLIKQKKPDIIVKTDIDPSVPQKIRSDKKKIYQILTNLTSNATKFTQRGEIIISIKSVFDTYNEGWIKNSHPSKIRIQVRDTGIGIDSSKFEKIFNRYSQADESTTRKYGGSGIGLALCKQLAELMEGSIQVKSELNKGSVFEFEVPISQALNRSISLDSTMADVVISPFYTSRSISNASISTKTSNLSSPESLRRSVQHLDFTFNTINTINSEFDESTIKKADQDVIDVVERVMEGSKLDGSNKSILSSAFLDLKNLDFSNLEKKVVLIVEDNTINSKVLRKLLELLGESNIVICSNGQDAIDYTKLNYNLIKIILMDVHMPILDGIASTKAIREFEKSIDVPKIKIYGLSASSSELVRQECMEAGMDDYLIKPIKKEDLARLF